ncbi:MAG TPA: hypothetical protein VEL72_01315 [Ktedonobacteraceae bacterium]|nr:hypothetical protein [Ktedonobacteraceae bacterium]
MVVDAPPRTLEKMCEAFPLAHQKRNDKWANEDNPRFDFWESTEKGKEGNILIHSWTGRTVENILSMGKIPLRKVDLYAHKGQSSKVISRDKLDLLDLAQYMKIDWQWLLAEGFSDGYTYTYPNGDQVNCVKLGGYFTPDGKEHSKHQVRVSLTGKHRFYFNQNTPGEVIPCGLHYLDRVRIARYLFIGEGVSDFATMTFHGLPFIGIPGVDHVSKLDVSLLLDLPAIYILEEPDQVEKLSKTGRGFYASVRKHLRDNGYAGAIFSVRFMELTGFKDPSDLHKAIYKECSEQAEGPFREAVHSRFIEEIMAAKEQALPEGNERAPSLWAASPPAAISFEEWFMHLMSCNRDILPWPHLCILAFLFHLFRDQERDEVGWLIEPDKAALACGLGCEKDPGRTFRRILNEIQNKLGVLVIDPRSKKEDVGNGEIRHKGWDYYIRPRLSYYQPRGYVALIQDLRQQGGERRTCEECGSTRLRPYAVKCLDCGHRMYPPIEEDSEQDLHRDAMLIEATAIPLPLEDIAANVDNVKVVSTIQIEPDQEIPDVRKLCTSDKEEDVSHTQIAYVGNDAPPLDKPESVPIQSDKAPLSLEAEGYYKDTDELDPGWPPSMKMKKRVYVPPALWAAVMS